MNPQDISNKKFEKSTFGYKVEDVEEYLRDVAIAYAKAVKEKEEDELKIVKLVEKINEYRNDGDAIRDALIVAQRESNKIVAEAKNKAEEIVAEAQTKRDTLLADIQHDCDALKRSEIEKVAVAIKAEQEKLNAVEAAAKTRLELQNDRLNSLKKEVTDFKRKLLVMLDEQIKLAVALPELTDEQIEDIMNAVPENSPEQAENTPDETPHTEDVKPPHEKSEEQKAATTAFGFSEFKRSNYSADELKFGQNAKH